MGEDEWRFTEKSFAQLTSVVGGAHALEFTDAIDTCPSMLANDVRTFVDL